MFPIQWLSCSWVSLYLTSVTFVPAATISLTADHSTTLSGNPISLTDDHSTTSSGNLSGTTTLSWVVRYNADAVNYRLQRLFKRKTFWREGESTNLSDHCSCSFCYRRVRLDPTVPFWCWNTSGFYSLYVPSFETRTKSTCYSIRQV
uniref:Secreted protein n=1 Tax=Cacopsylla melanoneura TaxID=428564 RepID=A0A8D8X397_9HEMI